MVGTHLIFASPWIGRFTLFVEQFFFLEMPVSAVLVTTITYKTIDIFCLNAQMTDVSTCFIGIPYSSKWINFSSSILLILKDSITFVRILMK